MASEKQTDFAIVIRAIDKATAPVRAMRVRLERALAPLADVSKKLDAGLGLKKIGEKWDGVRNAVGRVSDEVFKLGARLAGIAAVAGGAFYTIIKGAMDAGDQLGEQANRVGLTVDAFASLRFAAAQADVSQEAFAGSMDKLNKQLGDMKVGKGGEFLSFLNEISPTFAKQVKGAKSTEAAMALLTDAFAKIDDPSKRATLAAHAFGKSNLQMGEFLHQGSAAIQEQQRRYMELAGSQEEFAKRAGDLDNATRETSIAFEGLRNTFATAFFPVLTKLAEKLTGLLSSNRGGLAAWAERAAAAFDGWLSGGGLDRLVETLGGIADTIGKVVGWLGPMGTGFAVAGVALAPLLASLVSLGSSLVSLGVTLAPLFMAAWSAIVPMLGSLATAFAGVGTSVGVLMLEFLPFLAAAAGLILAAKAIRDNWGDLVILFDDFGGTVQRTFDAIFGDGRFDKLIGFFTKLTSGGGLDFGSLFGPTKADKAEEAYQRALRMPPAGAAPRVSSAPPVSSSSTVEVNFSNLPRGARVSSPEGDAPVSVSAGYSMVTP